MKDFLSRLETGKYEKNVFIKDVVHTVGVNGI